MAGAGSRRLFAQLFGCAPVYDIVLSCLEPRSLVWVALTCRLTRLAVADFKRRAFNVNRHFARYFADPIAFRSLQAKTNTLVSGSDALQFLDRTFYPESDLDLYTHPGHSFEVAQFLVAAEGYQFAPRGEQNQDWRAIIRDDWDGTQPRAARGMEETYPLEGIAEVWTFKKPGAKQETLNVQIIEAASSPLEAILKFHSTCVMNFITADAAYSLYPLATFVDRGALVMPSGRRTPGVIRKYVRRGWRVYFVHTPDNLSSPAGSPFMLGAVRWVGDERTWVLPLDQTGVKERPPLSRASAPLKFDHVLCNGWTLRPYKGFELNGYECHSYKVQATAFRYNYAIPDADVWYAIRRWAHIQEKLNRETIGKEDWVWYDADLPSFLRDVWKRAKVIQRN